MNNAQRRWGIAAVALAVVLWGPLSASAQAPRPASPGAARPSAPDAARPASADGNYVVGPDDRLKITVWNQNDISGEYNVERDSTFTFPLIGRVQAKGLTLSQLEAELRRQLADGFYKNPQVTVAVIEYRSKRVFVMGALREPGTYPLTGEMSLIEVLSKAGSPAPDAADYALIVRSKSATSGPVLPGQDEAADVTRVDLRQLNGGQLSPDLMVRDGDTVYVPRAFSVYVYGQVRRPGSYPIGQDTTVLQALSLAGGVSEYGAANRVRILRVEKGEKREFRVEMNEPLQPGDTVIVPERFF